MAGVDSKTVSRWENDKDPMGPVSERLLRLIVRDLEPVPEGSASWIMHTFPGADGGWSEAAGAVAEAGDAQGLQRSLEGGGVRAGPFG